MKGLLALRKVPLTRYAGVDYLISSFAPATAAGLSLLLDNAYSHDQITRFLPSNAHFGARPWGAGIPPREQQAVSRNEATKNRPYVPPLRRRVRLSSPLILGCGRKSMPE
jgi:hypothetical protein